MNRIDYSKYSLLPGTRADAIQLLRRCWQAGDTMRVAEWLGLDYIPPTPPPDIDLDAEWQLMIADARAWIEDIYRRVWEPVPA